MGKMQFSDLTEEKKKELISLYIDEDLSQTQVSRKSGVTLSLVYKFFKQENIHKDRMTEVIKKAGKNYSKPIRV